MLAYLLCGCVAMIAAELADEPVLRCPRCCTAVPFIIEEPVTESG